MVAGIGGGSGGQAGLNQRTHPSGTYPTRLNGPPRLTRIQLCPRPHCQLLYGTPSVTAHEARSTSPQRSWPTGGAHGAAQARMVTGGRSGRSVTEQ